jgi:hypothetical protein
MQTIYPIIIFITIVFALLSIFLFKDHTQFESEFQNNEIGKPKNYFAKLLRKFYSKFMWTINESDKFKLSMINDSASNFVRYKFTIGGVALIASLVMTKNIIVSMVVFGVGWFIPTLIISSQYSNWVTSIASEMPTLTRYLILYTSMGFNMRNSLISSTQYINGPLSTLLENCNTNINSDGDYEYHLKQIRAKVRGKYESHIDAVLKRISSGWVSPNVDSFKDIEAFLFELEEASIERATGSKKIKYMMLLPLAFMSVGLMILPNVLNWLYTNMFTFQ